MSLFYTVVGILAVALLPAIPVQATVLVSSTFDTHADGWTIVNDGTNLTHHASGGNPGGYISVDDLAIGDIWRFRAPAKFRGDQSAAFGGFLQFDLSQSGSTADPQFEASEVILVDTGPDPDLTLVFNTAHPAFFPIWTSYTVPFIASAGWQVGSLAGPAATDAQLLQVLSSLNALQIRGEFISGPDTGSLDNVRLAAVTEPGTLCLFGGGLVGLLGIAARRRKQKVAAA